MFRVFGVWAVLFADGFLVVAASGGLVVGFVADLVLTVFVRWVYCVVVYCIGF